MVLEQNKIAPADKAQPAVTDDEKAKAEAEAAAAEAAHPEKGKHVLYLGPSNAVAAYEAGEYKKRVSKLGEGTVAEITAANWASVGVESKRGHRWDLSNNWKIPATQFTEEQLDYLLTNSKRFALVDDSAKADS